MDDTFRICAIAFLTRAAAEAVVQRARATPSARIHGLKFSFAPMPGKTAEEVGKYSVFVEGLNRCMTYLAFGLVLGLEEVRSTPVGLTPSCDECCGEGTTVEQFEPVPGGGMPGDDQMGVSIRQRVRCPVCKGSGVAQVERSEIA